MRYTLMNFAYLLCLSLFIGACGDQNTQESSPLDAARGKMDAGAFKEAISLLDGMIEQEPNNPKALNMRGVAHVNLEAFGKALSDFNAAIEQDGSQYMFYYNRGNVQRKLQNDSEAIADYSRAISLDENKYQVWLNRALAYASTQQADSAVADFQQAVTHGGQDDPLVHYYQGRLLLDMGKYDESISALEGCLKIAPEHTLAHYSMALAYLGAGHSQEEACEHANQAFSLGYIQAGNLINEYCGGIEAMEETHGH